MTEKNQQLNKKTRKGLNDLGSEDIWGARGFAYAHEILRYGVSAVAHNHIAKMARGIHEGKLSIDEFIRRYGLDFTERRCGGFSVPLAKIENDGIFIPQQAYWNPKGIRLDRLIWLFEADLGNRVELYPSWVNKEYARKLIKREWKPSDLENPGLVKQGMQFSIDLMVVCADAYENLIKKYVPSDKAKELTRKLIAHYSELVNAN